MGSRYVFGDCDRLFNSEVSRVDDEHHQDWHDVENWLHAEVREVVTIEDEILDADL